MEMSRQRNDDKNIMICIYSLESGRLGFEFWFRSNNLGGLL